MNEFKLKVIEYKRGLVKELLDQCTDKQQLLFNRMYKNIDEIKEEKMGIVYDQCKKTVEKNKKENNNE